LGADGAGFVNEHKRCLKQRPAQLLCPTQAGTRLAGRPPTEIIILPDNITICHHCYGLPDENFKLVTEEKPVENIRAA
jgi:hypothetical protein